MAQTIQNFKKSIKKVSVKNSRNKATWKNITV